MKVKFNIDADATIANNPVKAKIDYELDASPAELIAFIKEAGDSIRDLMKYIKTNESEQLNARFEELYEREEKVLNERARLRSKERDLRAKEERLEDRERGEA